MTPGTQVRLKRDVDRFPDFIARVGATGIVVTTGDDTFAVRLCMWLRGSEEWDNEIRWSPEHDDPLTDLEVLP